MHPSDPAVPPVSGTEPADGERRLGRAAGSSTVAVLDRDVPLRDARPPVDPAGDLDDDSRSSARPGGDERTDPAGVVPVGDLPALTRPVTPRRFRSPAPATDTLRGWLVTLVLTAVGAVVRFWNLGMASDAGTPIFDEKYYAIQAAELLRLGGIEENPGFGVVVHPPLGKDLIAIGEAIAGYNSFGWRLSSAIAGTLCILLIVRVARRLTGSTLLGGIAGVLLIADGVSHVQARSALLDVFQQLFVLAAFATLICDRDQVRARLAEATQGIGGAPGAGSRYGIALGFRWWRFATGLLLGCATAVKWSGVYWIAFFGVLSIVWDILARREAGVRRPVLGTVRRDLLPSLWSYVVVGIGTYVASWWAWFASESAWARHIYVADTQTWRTDRGGQLGVLHWLANLWHNSLWQWTWKMLDFHSTLLSPGSPGAADPNPANRHPWESKPWTWPMGTRPVLYYAPGDAPAAGCGDGVEQCVRRIFLIGTPALWWISLFVLGWALWRMIARLDWRYAAVIVGYAAGYLPWFVNLDRQMYFFYVTPLAPFLVLGITLMLGDVLGSRRLGIERRYLALAVVALYVGIVVANFIWLWPILVGDPITKARLTMETWLPSWG